MLAEQDISLSAAAETIYELSEDERIQQECEAREDFLLRQQGMADMITELKEENTDLKKENADQKQEIARLKALLASQSQYECEGITKHKSLP